MKQWGSVFEQDIYDDGMLLLAKDCILENLDDNIAALGWVRKRLEKAVVDTPPEGGKLDAVWHHKRGWIHPVDEIRRAAKAVAADELIREEAAEAMGLDLEEIDAANARDRVRIQLGDATFYDCRLQSTLADGTAQDQIAPGTWMTLPEGFDVDVDPFEITDPEETMVVASADTQTDGTKVWVVEININGESGGAKLVHGSGGIVPPRAA